MGLVDIKTIKKCDPAPDLFYVIQAPSPCYSYTSQKSRKFIICFSQTQ